MDKLVVTELIQDNCNKKTIKIELSKILETEFRKNLLHQYDLLEQQLGGVGASEKTAQLIINDIKK